MNKKNKTLLGAIALVLLSGIAATGSTFAWFTTVRTAGVNYNSATIYSLDGNLKIQYVGSKNTVNSPTYDATTNTVSITGVNQVTDISGDGLTFYKPVWTKQTGALDSHEASSIDALDLAGATAADDYFIDFTVRLSRDNDIADPGFKVYLGQGSGIAPVVFESGVEDYINKNIRNENAVKATRLAVIVDNVVVYRWASENDTQFRYIEENASETPKLYNVGYRKRTVDTNIGVGDFTTYATQGAAATDAATNPLAKPVVDLSTNEAVTKDVTIRAWIEGEDEECINEIVTGVFEISLNFYALLAD